MSFLDVLKAIITPVATIGGGLIGGPIGAAIGGALGGLGSAGLAAADSPDAPNLSNLYTPGQTVVTNQADVQRLADYQKQIDAAQRQDKSTWNTLTRLYDDRQKLIDDMTWGGRFRGDEAGAKRWLLENSPEYRSINDQIRNVNAEWRQSRAGYETLINEAKTFSEGVKREQPWSPELGPTERTLIEQGYIRGLDIANPEIAAAREARAGVRADQLAAAQRLADIAYGNAPTVAEMVAKQQAEQIRNQLASQVASQRGGFNPAAQRAAMMALGKARGELAGQTATQAEAERRQAASAYFDALSGIGQQDLSNKAQEIALQNALQEFGLGKEKLVLGQEQLGITDKYQRAAAQQALQQLLAQQSMQAAGLGQQAYQYGQNRADQFLMGGLSAASQALPYVFNASSSQPSQSSQSSSSDLLEPNWG